MSQAQRPIMAEDCLVYDAASIRMRNDNVLVRLRQRRDDYRGVLVLPDDMRGRDPDDAGRAVVVAAGPGYHRTRRLFPHRPERDDTRPNGTPQPTDESPEVTTVWVPMDPSLVPGAEVVLESHLSGNALFVGGAEHRIVRACEIAAVLEV